MEPTTRAVVDSNDVDTSQVHVLRLQQRYVCEGVVQEGDAIRVQGPSLKKLPRRPKQLGLPYSHRSSGLVASGVTGSVA